MSLVRAEFLKLRRRRGLVAAASVLTIVPVVVGYTVLAILHATNPEAYDPAGGLGNLHSSLELVAQIGVVAAILIGATAGAGDRGAGVFRELVVTGRSRLQLFAARIPGGLALLLPLVACAFAVATVASVALTGEQQSAVTAEAALQDGAWLGLTMTFAFLLALAVSSALSSRGVSIALLLGWQLAVAPILLASGKLDDVLPNAALLSFQPEQSQPVSTSTVTAVALLAIWTIVPLSVGAWRTRTADA